MAPMNPKSNQKKIMNPLRNIFIVLLLLFIGIVGCAPEDPTLPTVVVAKSVSYWHGEQQRYINHLIVVRDRHSTYTFRVTKEEYEEIQIGQVFDIIEPDVETANKEKD